MPQALAGRVVKAKDRRSPVPARRPSPPVRFVVLGPQVSVGWRPERGRTERMPAAVIGALHLAAVISLRVAVPSVATNDAPPVAVSYLDVPPPESPESPRAKVLQARPLVVAQSVIIPAAEGAVAHPDQAAGFQELLAPTNVPAVPPGELSGTAVREQDFSGRGIAGGVAGGKPPVALPDTMAARLAQQGEVSDAVTPVQRQHRERGYLDEEDVLVRPELRNVEDIRDALREYYPAVMRSAGIEGHVIIEFIVDSTGVVRPSSVRVIEASQPLFADAAIKVLRMAQFTPGRAEFGTRSVAVNVKVRVPLTWTMRHGTAPED